MFEEVTELPEFTPGLDEIDMLTPGDFKAVRDRMLIIHPGKASYDEIIRELKCEVEYKLNDPYHKEFGFSKN